MMPRQVLGAIRQRLAAVGGPVTLDYFHQSDSKLIVRDRQPCPACEPAKQALEQVAALSDRVELTVHEFYQEPSLVREWGVERVPGVVIRGTAGRPLHLYGLPGGAFLDALLDAIVGASVPPPEPPPELAAILEQIEGQPRIRVVGSLRDPASAGAIAAAFQLGLVSDTFRVGAFAVETYPDLAQQFRGSRLPSTIVKDRQGFAGVTTPEALAQFVLHVQANPGEAPPPPAAGGQQAAAAPKPAAAPDPEPGEAPLPDDRADIAVIGGGPAGLQAALVLARARKRVVVFDDPAPARNAASHGLHGFLGLDGLPPAEVRRVAWEQIEAYGGAELRPARVERVRRAAGGDFVVTTDEGAELAAHHVILAFGHHDVHPDLPGFAECWGETIISCPYCDGFEHQDRAWGIVIGSQGARATSPQLALNWSGDVKLILGGGIELPEQLRAGLAAAGIRTHLGTVTAVVHENGKVQGVRLDSGEEVAVETLVWTPEVQRSPLVSRLAEELGLQLNEAGFVAADPSGRTSLERMWAAGEAIGPGTIALEAARSGALAAFSIVEGWHG